MLKILVTGGAGFVGRHLVRRFVEKGDEVHCVDRVVPLTGGIHPKDKWPLFDPTDYAGFRFFYEDCRSYFERVQDTDFDYVFHLAAMVGGRMMIEDQPLAVADDLSIDAAYWQWAVKAKPKKTVTFSSSAAYPIKYQTRECHIPLKENMIRFGDDLGQPDMTYGWAKLTNEYLGLLAYQKYGLRSIAYRPFSGYGEDQDKHYPFPAICLRVLQSLREKKDLQVWGSGQQIRDFIHIEDCIDGVLATMDQIDDSSAVNLSTGIGTTFIDLGKMVAACCDFYPQVLGMSDKPEGVFSRVGDTAKQKELGFLAATPLKKGILQTLNYFTKAGIPPS